MPQGPLTHRPGDGIRPDAQKPPCARPDGVNPGPDPPTTRNETEGAEVLHGSSTCPGQEQTQPPTPARPLLGKFIIHHLLPPSPTTALLADPGAGAAPQAAPGQPLASPRPPSQQDGRSAPPGPRAPCSSPPWCPGSRCPPRAGGCGSC